MQLYRKIFLTWLALTVISPRSTILADVVVDMPAPPKASKPAQVAEPAPPADPAANSAASSTAPPGPVAAQPTVGQIALTRYARARRRPHDTYYIANYSRFGGYYWPYSHHYWGPYNLGGWNYFWPGWTWGNWTHSFNCNQSSSGSSGSSSSGSSSAGSSGSGSTSSASGTSSSSSF